MPGNCKRSEDKIEKLCSGCATIFILILIWMAGSEILGKGVGYEYDIYAKVTAGKQTGVSLNDPAPKKMGGDDLQCLCNSQQCKRKELLRRQRQGNIIRGFTVNFIMEWLIINLLFRTRASSNQAFKLGFGQGASTTDYVAVEPRPPTIDTVEDGFCTDKGLPPPPESTQRG
nr:hypothetical protein Iba_chr12aCG9230 [Ipomoea batatas]